jgi:hypothetical protein
MRNHYSALVVCAIALVLHPQAGSGAPRFSRAAWIEEHEVELHFDGGALPARIGDELPAPSAVRAEAGAVATAGVPNLVVNAELVEPDDRAAQPETQAEPFLAVDPGNERRLLAGYQDARFQDGGARALGFALSTTAGRKWGSGLIPNLTVLTGGPWERASDPWVAFGPGHVAYYVSLAFDESSPDNAVVVSTSRDGGASWGDPVTVHSPTGRDFDDKEAIVVDTRAGSPFFGRVYVAWDMAPDTGNVQPVLFSWSDDEGASFSPAVTVTQGTSLGVVPLVGPGGVVHLVWTNFASATRAELLTSRSEDGGASWSAPVRIADVFAAGVPGMRTGDGLGAAAVDPKTGSLYVVWQDARDTGSVDQVLFSRSTDGGESWSEPRRISDGPGDAAAFTPAIAVDGKGRVAVSYYSLRNDPSRSLGVDLYCTLSSDRGQSFGASRRLSGRTWDATFAAFSRGKFLGDYQGLVGGSRTFTALFVATQRRSALDASRFQPDVFTATVR